MRKLELDVIKKAILSSSGSTSILIGCDSQKFYDSRKKLKMASYARVVVIHKDSKHGCEVYGDVQKEVDYGNLRMRLMRECQIATDLACELVEVIGDRHLAVHLDINSDNKEASFVAMKEAAGYVRGMLGIDATFKPDALAASYAADRLAR